MTKSFAFEFAIPFEETLAFAELSGDHNPLHVDPVAARRTQFGGTVVHGIHAILKAADSLAAHWAQAGLEPIALSANFSNPIRNTTRVSAHVTATADEGRTKVTAEVAGRPAFTLSLTTGRSRQAAPARLAPCATTPARQPRELPFPPPPLEGEVPLRVDPGALARLFPNLARKSGHLGWVADLMASTRIVGMECPGLHSVYSGFRLTRLVREPASETAAMRYRIDRIDPRFHSARIAVTGACYEGMLDTFFRAPAVEQRSLSIVTGSVQPGIFQGQRALVVGGSRGLGEVAAKILLAGGASVTITYARGLADAQRIQGEAQSLGLPCSVQPLDVTSAVDDAPPDWLTGGAFSHVYFFASPHIEKNTSGRWKNEVFEGLAEVYVRGFARLTGALASSNYHSALPIRILFPSSIFLDTQEQGFAEYCAAKAAGEALAKYLAQRLGAIISAPRLPRLLTDQTSVLLDVGAGDPFPVMLELLQKFHS